MTAQLQFSCASEIGGSTVPAVAIHLPPEALRWNQLAERFPKILSCSTKRLQHLRARRRDPFWVQNLEAAIKRIATSRFCLGDNERGWVADFDWFLRPDTVSKIMEGKYDNRVKHLPPIPRLKSIEAVIAQHPANKESRHYDPNCSPKLRDELRKMKTTRDELHRLIANGGER